MQQLLLTVVNVLYYALLVLLIGRLVISLANISPYHPVAQIVYRFTEPLLNPVRRILPPSAGLDFSPMIVWLLAALIRQVLAAFILSG
jgi:YggT family protein